MGTKMGTNAIICTDHPQSSDKATQQMHMYNLSALLALAQA